MSILKDYPQFSKKELISLHNHINKSLSSSNFEELILKKEYRHELTQKKINKTLTECINQIEVFNKKHNKKLKGEEKKILLKKIIMNFYDNIINKIDHYEDKFRNKLEELSTEIENEINDVFDELIDILKDCINITNEFNTTFKKIKLKCKSFINKISECIKKIN